MAEELESLNIATEAILFFAIGLALQASSFFANLPVAIFIWLGITFIRPLTVYLFFRGSELQPEERMLLSFWSPKGAISMAFIVTSPALLEETFGINLIELIPEGAYLFTSEVVCGAVLISMIVNSLMIPKLHSLFISFFPKSPQS